MRVTLTARVSEAYKPSDAEPKFLPCLPYREAFTATYPDDRHFLPFWFTGDDSDPNFSLRVKKYALRALREQGYDLLFQVLVLDLDLKANPGLQPPTDPLWGWYRTKNGLRVFAELSEPIAAEHYESALHWARDHWRDRGLVVDPKCKDWTHIYRLGRVVRDGVPQETEVVFPTEQLIPPAFVARVPEAAPIAVVGSSRYLEEARDWIENESEVAVAGDGGDLTTYKVAEKLIRGFSLPIEEAYQLMLWWNEWCEPPWEPERLKYKLEQALEHGRTPPGAAVFSMTLGKEVKEKTGAEPEKKPKKQKAEPGSKPPKDERYEIPDLQLARLLGAELNRELGPISAINKTLYRLVAGDWVPLSDRDFYAWVDRWDGVSPDPAIYKPIKFSFARAKALLENLTIRFDISDEIRARSNILFYTKQGAVTLDGIEPYTPTIGIQVLEQDWNAQDDCPKFQEFMDEILPRRDQEFIRNFVGLCLLGRGTEVQTALCFEGAGANGKSVLILLISRLFPTIYKTCVSPKLMNDEAKLWPFKLAKINIVSDLSLRNLDDPAGLKQIVAGDEIMARRLYEDPVTIKPFAGNLFSANLPPKADDVSQAFIRRWLIVYFAKRIPEHLQIQGLDELLWKAEAVGICKWFMLGAANVVAAGKLEIPLHVRQEMKDWAKDQDPVRRYVTALTEGLDEFDGGAMLDKVNILLQRESLNRTSSRFLAEYYRILGYVSSHSKAGTIWKKRESHLKLITG